MTANATATSRALEASELEQVQRYLEQTLDGVQAATAGLTEAQWSFKPAPERWSIAEIVEHIVMVQELVLGPVRERLLTAPPDPRGESKIVDAIVLERFPDRTVKFSGPPQIHPTGRWSPAVSLERCAANTARLSEHVANGQGLREHAVEALPLKALTQGAYELMDGYQWVLAEAAHTDRHIRQIEEVKADANFPS